MATFQGRGGELFLNGKSYGLAEWESIEIEPTTETREPISFQWTKNLIGVEFSAPIKSFCVPCKYTFTFPSGYGGTCKGMVNLTQWRAYIYVEVFDIYALVNIVPEPRADEPKARGVQFVATTLELDAAEKWIVGD